MRRRVLGILVSLCALLAAIVSPIAAGARVEAQPEPQPEQQPEQSAPASRTVRWLGLGDSYSAGEGLPHASAGAPYGAECQRALATDDSSYSSKAWAPLAANELSGTGGVDFDFDFVACTGAISDDVFAFGSHPFAGGQLEEALAGHGAERPGDFRWDVVSFSMGGNDVSFSDVVKDCIGVDAGGAIEVIGDVVTPGPTTWLNSGFVGCSFEEQSIKDRIDRMTDTSSVNDFSCVDPEPLTDDDGRSEANGDASKVTLPELYDYVAQCVVADGGTVVIMGYPQVVEQSSLWNDYDWKSDRCQRIRRSDHGKLRGIAAHLNYKISQTVDWANERNSNVQFTFVDPNQFFEGDQYGGNDPSEDERYEPRNRHALCGAGDDFLNGVMLGGLGTSNFRYERSFHPNQLGQNAMGKAVVERVGGLIEQGQFDYITPGDRASRPQPGVDAGAEEMPIMLVVDTSGSMGDDDGTGRIKIEAAKSSILDFLGGAERDIAVGMRVYPDTSGSSCGGGRLQFNVRPRDPEDMSAGIRQLVPDGDTPTAEALLAAADDVRQAGYSQATIVLVSDGESTCTPPCDAAMAIAASGLQLQVITVGFQISAAGQQELQCVAAATGGLYVDVDDSVELEAVMDEFTRPDLLLRVSYTESIVPSSGFTDDGVAEIVATVENTTQIEARNVITRFGFLGVSPGVVSPVRALGNLAPGSAREVRWTFRPGVSLAGSSVDFEVTAGADNGLADSRAEGSVAVGGQIDSGGLADLGSLIDGRSLVVVGDSYSAGEGAEGYLDGTDTDSNKCHRSRSTYLVELLELPDSHVIACSGAVMQDIQYPNDGNGVDSQLRQLWDLQQTEGALDGVVMTVGGNDIGFSKIAQSCIFYPDSCGDTVFGTPTREFIAERITIDGPDSFVARLITTYAGVSAVINSPDAMDERRGAAPIFVLAYPRPLPTVERGCRILGFIDVFDQGEMAVVTDLVTELNGHIEAATLAAQQQGIPVYFVDDTEDALLPNHTACDREPYVRSFESANLSAPDVNTTIKAFIRSGGDTRAAAAATALGILKRTSQELFHPNREGYAALTQAVARWSTTSEATGIGPHLDGVEPGEDVEPYRSNGEAVEVRVDVGESLRVERGAIYRVRGSGFAPGLPVEVIVRSAPRVLALATADANGDVSIEVVLPLDLAVGQHELQLDGLDPQIERHVQSRDILVVDESGVDAWLIIGAVALGLLLVSTLLLLVDRRRRHPDRSVASSTT